VRREDPDAELRQKQGLFQKKKEARTKDAAEPDYQKLLTMKNKQNRTRLWLINNRGKT